MSTRRAAPSSKTRRPPAKTQQRQIAAALKTVKSLKPLTPGAVQVVALLTQWLSDESGYDEETWPELKKTLNRERRRVGARRLFVG